MRVRPEDWVPVDLDSIENSANDSIKNDSNIVVMAGPGAGKTELLAQKACYLLQTNSCISPKRILAISFKTDSASNLKKRTELRAGVELARRFESYTFDAFAKSLLERFRLSLPVEFRISKNYEIGFTNVELFDLLSTLPYQERPATADLENILRSTGWARNNMLSNFIRNHLLSFRLDNETRNREYILNWAADRIWELLIQGDPESGTSKVSFQMISRLSELIVRSNPYVKRALQSAYGHVFLDEFQDTTNIQYDFLKTCFLNSSSTITAVGDNKQRIMLWAGALDGIFNFYQEDFSATRFDLIMNYRCAPALVDLQTIFAQHIDEMSEGQTSDSEEGGIVKRIDFVNENQEAEGICTKILSLINDEEIPPEKICIIFKQKVDQNSVGIINRLAREDVKARAEDRFQDLLKEEFIIILLSFIKCTFEICPDAWGDCISYMVEDRDLIPGVRRTEGRLRELRNNLQAGGNDIGRSLDHFSALTGSIVNFIGMERLLQITPQYSDTYITNRIDAFNELFFEILSRSENIGEAVNEFEGVGVIPCMTIHKSKGLEFEVVFLIGLEDGMYWNFRNEPMENIQAVFVAISRPINQLYITYSHQRSGRVQSRNVISVMYDLLNQGNVEHVIFNQD